MTDAYSYGCLATYPLSFFSDRSKFAIVSFFSDRSDWSIGPKISRRSLLAVDARETWFPGWPFNTFAVTS